MADAFNEEPTVTAAAAANAIAMLRIMMLFPSLAGTPEPRHASRLSSLNDCRRDWHRGAEAARMAIGIRIELLKLLMS
jgi:hypothetical protein